MAAATTEHGTPGPAPEHVDVLVVGAGLSGIGAACHLQRTLPGRSYAILEARDTMGGTWDLFRYPGIRSDSDMYTLGYRFRPWRGEKSITDGGSILDYIRETAAEYDVERHIRYGHRVTGLSWSDDDARWTATCSVAGRNVVVTASAVLCASGYYRYDRGHTPDLPGIERFGGTVVHPQHWPADLDHTGRRVVVVGSGATAVTLAPAMGGAAASVTMLQRSPTYIVPLAARDAVADRLRRFLPERLAYRATRLKNAVVHVATYQLCQRFPNAARRLIRTTQRARLPEGYDLDTHFTPRYDPWDQRLCVTPDAELFRSIRRGELDIVTDRIATFTPDGIELESGRELPADLVVTATGLELLAFGGIELTVNGEPVDVTTTMAYRGMMLSGVPNFAYVIGYTNASWTLKADLVSEHFCRLLAHMAARGLDTVVPVRDPSVGEEPFLDFDAGYVLRALDSLPKQGSRAPWRLRTNYFRDLLTFRFARVDDPALQFSRRRRPASVATASGR
ncbi:NAD(P)/FAD-dependent oxidoreductase [Rhodococcus rhodnii]|uniref:Flavin binding monooxygenase n=2 Tax=Rhodococcus rhodnii TaxID=38312 RepID=R7WL91_9NOCA|nr:NAD(P)/FAD-dependent oxidoreductase [Rhodococcus rhodnii]EOM74759.1 flavin binding monooxygenase [Rhodococcus rhodnii LMG 5362]TXG89857.1 NAD(P)/FAD-dependent oxidoreductase [Rhodococcus rhodnii]